MNPYLEEESVFVSENTYNAKLISHIFWSIIIQHNPGGGDSSVVRAPDSWMKGRGFVSLQEPRENFLLQGQLSVLTLLSVSVPPRATSVARKRSRSFCQKCRWQVTAKHASTLRMWLCMKWHGAWLYGVHRACAETAAVLCGTSHASTVSTPLWWILKTRYRKLVTHVKR